MASDPTAVELTQNDTEPMEIAVRDKSGIVPLPQNTTATFRMKLIGGPTLVEHDCTILDESAGLVEVAWATDDLDTPGLYRSEVEVIFPNGKVKTFPSQQTIDVRQELG